jgi:predicted nucleic acid-binding protein
LKPWLVDTGPIVALIEDRDAHHDWALEQTRHAPATVRTCEAVVTEALFLLKRHGRNEEGVFALLESGHLQCDFGFRDERREVQELMQRYREQPMSFADACLVRMAELEPEASIWTLDEDFRVYRRFGRQTLSLVMP